MWTVVDVFRSGGLFVLAGLAEIGGGWLVWQYVRGGKPWWWTLIGAATLVAYGFIPTLQPAAASDDFGRVSACYGGVFIAMCFGWGRVIDKMELTVGDLVGGLLCLAGIVVILGWPRGQTSEIASNTTIGSNRGVELGVAAPVGEESSQQTHTGSLFRPTDVEPGVTDEGCGQHSSGPKAATALIQSDALGQLPRVHADENEPADPSPDLVEHRA
jgi:small multidrug resistance family-3 protein